jgi:hypothetical protein
VDGEDFRTPNDILGAILLSSLTALARSHQFAELDPLRPYTVLRRMWDDTVTGRDPHESALMLAAAPLMRAWLRTAATPPGAPAPRPDALPPPADPEKRRNDLLDKLERLQAHLGRQYLAPGQLGAAGGGDYSLLDHPEALSRVPLFHEIAPDVYVVVKQLVELVGGVSLGEGPSERDLLFDEALG